MSFIFTFSRNALSVFLDGTPLVIDNTHPNWNQIFEIVTGKTEGTVDELRDLIDTRPVLDGNDLGGRVTVGYDTVLLDGKPIHSHLTQRMLEMRNHGIDIAPWARFMEKLYQNPSKTAVDELFLWLEQSNMPITSAGNFLAYKKVRDDYGSYFDGGQTSNKIGEIPEMTRNAVDDNRQRTCSEGLHFCSFQYLPNYYGSQGRVVILEIDPADVVSIPSDYDNAKGRAWRYKVVGEVDENKARFAFVDTPVVDSDWDDDDDDDDDYDWT